MRTNLDLQLDLQNEADLANIATPHPSPVAAVLGLTGAVACVVVIARFLLWVFMG